MTEQKGLKIEVKFVKHLYHTEERGNFAKITARVSIKRAKGLKYESSLLKKALGANYDYTYVDEHFETAAEAEQWAAVSVEKITREYQVQRARVDSLEIPEDYEMFA